MVFIVCMAQYQSVKDLPKCERPAIRIRKVIRFKTYFVPDVLVVDCNEIFYQCLARISRKCNNLGLGLR